MNKVILSLILVLSFSPAVLAAPTDADALIAEQAEKIQTLETKIKSQNSEIDYLNQKIKEQFSEIDQCYAVTKRQRQVLDKWDGCYPKGMECEKLSQ